MPATLPKFPGAIAGRHLGRKPAPHSMRMKVLPLAPFLKRMGAKPPPDSIDYSQKGRATLAQMLANDQTSDCTIAAVLHQGGVHTAEQPGGTERVPTSQEAVTQYQAICGPGDQGCYIPEVMDAWRDRGLLIGGKQVKADGYVSLTLGDELLAKTAIYLFGPIHFGINLPNDWYVNANAGFRWDVTNSRIVGGHSIAIPGYDTTGFRVSTWGQVGTMTFAAFHRPEWVEEIYATLSPDWYDKGGLDEHGVNVQALKDALEAIRSGGTPDIPPEPVPTPPAPPGPTPTPHELDWTIHILGYALRLYAGYSLSEAKQRMAATDWLKLIEDVWTVAKSIRAQDWTAAGAGVIAILGDLGVLLTDRQRQLLHGAVRGIGSEYHGQGGAGQTQNSPLVETINRP